MTNQLYAAIQGDDGNPKLLDTATGALSPAAFTLRLEETAALARRLGHGMSVLLIDVRWLPQPEQPAEDDVAYDMILSELVDRFWARARQSDTIARIGPARLAILLPATDHDGGALYARKLLPLLEGPYPFGAAALHAELSVTVMGTEPDETPSSAYLLDAIATA
jgi:GGDEF domain-containing protein